MVADPKLCGTQYNIQKKRAKHTFRSPSGKEKQLDYVVIDRRNRRCCTDAEASDMIHFPMRKKRGGGLETKKQKQNLCTDTRYARYLATVEPREDPDSSDTRNRKYLNGCTRRRRRQQPTMKRKYLSNNTQRERRQQQPMCRILEQKHAATTVTITNGETEILEQPTAFTASRKEEKTDSEDQELLAFIDGRKICSLLGNF